MFQTAYPERRTGREDRIRQPSNNLYIFEYRSSRSKSKKKNAMDLAETRHEKTGAYLLKQEQIRERINQISEQSNNMDHRSNIDRLMNLISKSRTFIKTDDSGCEKVVRALSKMIYSQQNLKGAVQALKRYTMTCSSNNLQLFIQSKHNMKETIKIKPSDPALQKIHEIQENGFNYEFSKNQVLNESKESISFQLQNPLMAKFQSKENLTTQEDLQYLDKELTPIKEYILDTSYQNRIIHQCYQIKPRIANTPISFIINQQPFKLVKKKQEQSKPSPELKIESIALSEEDKNQSNDSDEIQLLFSQVTPLFSSKAKQMSKMTKQKVFLNNNSKNSGKSSPIYNLLYATSIQNQPLPENTNKKSKIIKNASKKDVLSPSQYAEKMLFGDPIRIEQKIPAQKYSQARNTLILEQRRRRISSLPKITFTYTSRQKYQINTSPDYEQQRFPITIYKTKKQGNTKDSSCKNTNKEDLHTTISSKQTKPTISQRQNPRFGAPNPHQNQYSTSGIIRCPIRTQKVIVKSPKPNDQSSICSSFNPPPLNEYYGDANFQMKRFDMQSQAMEQRRERILTAQPGWQNDVEFVSLQRQLPACCWSGPGKQTRSRSLNDRMLVGGYQNIFQ